MRSVACIITTPPCTAALKDSGELDASADVDATATAVLAETTLDWT
jgi:hypothetical protein